MQVEKPTVLALDISVRLAEFELQVKERLSLSGVTAVFGPSGSGKTTLLRVLAGLEHGATGTVAFAGSVWQDTARGEFHAAYDRPIGYVFQDARLFGHLDVDGNLRYAATRAATSAIRYDDVVSAFDLESLLGRNVASLSGGETQRVAIARTLLVQPRLLLLDEPLAALDAARKSEILPYLEALPSRFEIPIIYVSHAVDEVARLADQVVLLSAGRITAVGSTTDLLNRLDAGAAHSEVATILEAKVIGQDAELHLTRLEYRGQTLVVPELSARSKDDVVRLFIRAGDVAIATERPVGTSFRNVLEGRIASIDPDPDGPFALVGVDIGGVNLRANLTRHAVAELALKPECPVFAMIKSASFDRPPR